MPNAITKTPHEIAEDIADRYFSALASEMPIDATPGDVSLIEEGCSLALEIAKLDPGRSPDDFDAALRAGYLIGVAIGRRMGGAAIRR
jgi:hypothetical protein